MDRWAWDQLDPWPSDSPVIDVAATLGAVIVLARNRRSSKLAALSQSPSGSCDKRRDRTNAFRERNRQLV